MSVERESQTENGRASVVKPIAMFGFRDGAAWVASDVFVTRTPDGDLLVERWDGAGVRTATVRKGGDQLLRILWEKLNELAIA